MRIERSTEGLGWEVCAYEIDSSGRPLAHRWRGTAVTTGGATLIADGFDVQAALDGCAAVVADRYECDVRDDPQARSAQGLAIDLHARRYPDTTGTALLHLRLVEARRQHRGHEGARHWGHGPQHEDLRRLGLVTFGEPARHSGVYPVDLTDLGRDCAAMLDALRRGCLLPRRCRCCGALADIDGDLCDSCSRPSLSDPAPSAL